MSIILKQTQIQTGLLLLWVYRLCSQDEAESNVCANWSSVIKCFMNHHHCNNNLVILISLLWLWWHPTIKCTTICVKYAAYLVLWWPVIHRHLLRWFVRVSNPLWTQVAVATAIHWLNRMDNNRKLWIVRVVWCCIPNYISNIWRMSGNITVSFVQMIALHIFTLSVYLCSSVWTSATGAHTQTSGLSICDTIATLPLWSRIPWHYVAWWGRTNPARRWQTGDDWSDFSSPPGRWALSDTWIVASKVSDDAVVAVQQSNKEFSTFLRSSRWPALRQRTEAFRHCPWLGGRWSHHTLCGITCRRLHCQPGQSVSIRRIALHDVAQESTFENQQTDTVRV